MRKYFLLSAVALLTATTANATTDYAEVTAKATIEVAGTFDCSDLKFGTIVVKQNNAESTVSINNDYEDESSFSKTGDIISWTGADFANCGAAVIDDNFHGKTITLTSGENSMTAKLAYFSDYVMGTLTIPAQVEAGEYTGTFTVTRTY